MLLGFHRVSFFLSRHDAAFSLADIDIAALSRFASFSNRFSSFLLRPPTTSHAFLSFLSFSIAPFSFHFH